MSFKPLSLDYKDELFSKGTTQRKYKQTVNEDGTVSFEDMTSYNQKGSTYTAKDIIDERKAINDIYENKVDSLEEVESVEKEGSFCDALVAKELGTKVNVLNSRTTTGRALKIYDATENLTYGCWGEGMYTYSGYYGKGAPSDWAGMMYTHTVKDTSGETSVFVKIAWTAECKMYMMRQKKDGTIEKSWTEV